MKLYPYPSKTAEKRIIKTLERGLGFSKKDLKAVEAYLKDVRKRGDEALVEYTRRFDSGQVTIESLKVTPKEFDLALKSVDPEFLKTLDRSAGQLEQFHSRQ